MRLALWHAAGGFLVAAVFVASLVASPAGTVLRAAPPGSLLLLWLFCGLTFALVLVVMALSAPHCARPRGRPLRIFTGLASRPIPVLNPGRHRRG